MPADSDEQTRISRAVPLDQLRAPETDVREHRPQQAVEVVAESMGNPNVGQLQDVLVYPAEYDVVLEAGTEDELDELFREGHPMRIVDGETRRLAAEHLGWATLNATIVPEPPEETIVASVHANERRVDMSDYATVKAFYDHYEATDKTIEEVAKMAGYSRSYLNNMFRLLDAPAWLQEAWRAPQHPLEDRQALDVLSMISAQSIAEYASAGDLDDEQAHERAVKDAKLMIDVQAKHDLQAGEFSERCRRCKEETLDQLRNDTSPAEAQAQGQTERAEAEHSSGSSPEIEDCLACGTDRPHQRKFALPVCETCYGMLSDRQARGEQLAVAEGAGPEDLGPATAPADWSTSDLITALAEYLEVPEAGAQQALDVLEEQAAQPPE